MGKACKRRSRKGFEMKKTILYSIIALIIGALFIGCGSSGGYPVLWKTNKLEKENSFTSYWFNINHVKPEYKEETAKLECTRNAFLYVTSRETLKRGYLYFVIADNSDLGGYDNNLLGIPTVNYNAWSNYCNPEYRFKKTGLEGNKCQFKYLGYDMPNRIDSTVIMYKQKNYLFPTWDAKKTMEEARIKYSQCVDYSKYDKGFTDVNQTVSGIIKDWNE